MYLENLQLPEDLKKLNNAERSALCDEIREFLIRHVAKTGGHLAANLGVVELTVALHLTFDVYKDQLIWDVGHQSYVHKILTGRAEQFDTLRQFGGMSGFPKTAEDFSDRFDTGHSSTSISAALGYAMANQLQHNDATAVAIIGDGAMTGGMAFEAINHAGSLKTPLVVVLNDNGMSISKNVGGLSRRLKRIRNTNRYFQFKSDVKSILDHVPVLGKPIKNGLITFKRAMKNIILQNAVFEDMGFTYLGPVDGHNIEDLCTVLAQAKRLQEPVLVHVHTKKGKGYSFAEKNPGKYHGIQSFDYATGEPVKKVEGKSWSTCFGEELCKIAAKEDRITAITAAMPLGTGLETFSKMFPTRFFDVGIAEQHAVTFAAGQASAGLIPCFAVYSTFLQRAYDQILHDVALQNLHVVFCVDRSGPVGNDGETHQGVYDISFLSHIPNMRILAPANEEEMRKMLHYAIEQVEGPVAIRYPRGTVMEEAFLEDKEITRAISVCDGTDVLLLCVGTTVWDGKNAAEILGKKGIRMQVLHVRSVKPIDMQTIKLCVAGKKMIASVEDNVVLGGFGERVEGLLKRHVVKFGYPDRPIVQGSIKELKQLYGMDGEHIALQIEKSLAKQKVYG